jgi:hypothetical protein
MILAAFILAPAAVLGLGAFVMALLDREHERRRTPTFSKASAARGAGSK